MSYLTILAALLSAITAVATDIESAEPTLLNLWADLQAAYASIVSAITGGTTLTDDQLAKINATIAAAQPHVDAAAKKA